MLNYISMPLHEDNCTKKEVESLRFFSFFVAYYLKYKNYLKAIAKESEKW